MRFILLLLFVSGLSFSANANRDFTAEELERWFNSDDLHPVKTGREVNEGNLVFLNQPPVKPALHATNTFIIDEESIDKGWVTLSQCYEHLDPVRLTVVNYGFRILRGLQITSARNIEKASLEGKMVRLENVGQDAQLCVSAQVRNFYQNEDKSFSLVSGPYHRKFLDGYFPFRLTMRVKFDKALRFLHSVPQVQPGFNIELEQNNLNIDTMFEGRLKTELRFKLES